MAFENVKLEKKNQIAYVTIDRPKVLNALNMATMGELEEVFTDLAADRDIRVVILTGGGEKALSLALTSTSCQRTTPWKPRLTHIAARPCLISLRISASR